MNIHDLAGCAPVPLAHYLKALGILRLVSEQADPQARGWWDGERFRLATRLDRSEIGAFFLEAYKPSPILSPWNKASGFYKVQDPGLTPIENSTAERFQLLRHAIASSRPLLARIQDADSVVRVIKAESNQKHLSAAEKKTLRGSAVYKDRLNAAERRFKALKDEITPQIRLQWRGVEVRWMDAALVLHEDGSRSYPALLGSGGNDGNLEFSNNFLQRLGDLFDTSSEDGMPRAGTAAWFEGALWGGATLNCMAGVAVGQYLPGGVGGANSVNGPTGESQVNPVDFVLMMEGTVLFTAVATRRLGSVQSSRAVAPFVVSAQGAGYASSSDSDESAKGEQWMPLWSQPVTLVELQRLLGEGRAQLGARSARDALDLARAVASLGTARGIVAFERYSFIERNGQSNLAVPVGRFRVAEQAAGELACLHDLDYWLPRLRRAARDRDAPARLRLAERRLSDALFALVAQPRKASRWQNVLAMLVGIEAVQIHGKGTEAGPIPRLRPEWVAVADDGSAEFRLAVALALQGAGWRAGMRGVADPVRRHWLTLKNNGGFDKPGPASDRSMKGRRGIDDAIALVQRRLIEAGQHQQRRLPLVAAVRADAAPADLALLLAGEVDLDYTLELARALMAIDPGQWARQPLPPASARRGTFPDDGWLAVRLAVSPWALTNERRSRADPAIVRRLAAGDAASALRLALTRLRGVGIRTALDGAGASRADARLWAAALAFPVSKTSVATFARRIDLNMLQEDSSDDR